MAKITKDNVKHVAKLSRLELSEKELGKYTSEFEEILAYVEKIETANTPGVSEIGQMFGIENVSRDDNIKESLSTEDVLSNAPEKKDGFFKVKKVIEK